jgi:hypothetical protein
VNGKIGIVRVHAVGLQANTVLRRSVVIRDQTEVLFQLIINVTDRAK